jgi:hypothetical protein
MNTPITKQTSKDTYWIDEKGDKIPYNRLRKEERNREVETHKLLGHALKVNQALVDYKEEMRKICKKIYDQEMKAMGADPSKAKGNFTFYNFNQTIRVKVAIHEPVKFSDSAISAAKQFFDNFMEESITTKEDFLKDLINKAFEAKNGQLDSRRIFDLLSYKSRTKNQNYIKACECLEEGSTRPSSKTYFQIAFKDEEGNWENVELNFSKV